jgi:uncharacterized protein YcaQ
MELTKADTRAVFLAHQGIRYKPRWNTVPEVLTHIAAVQIDTIAVVARSHHLTLRNRIKNYHPDAVWEALRNHQIFEGWAHAACFLPIEDYPFYRPYIEEFPRRAHSWYQKRYEKYKDTMTAVYDRIRDEGPLGSRDFKDTQPGRVSGWWGWKPAKIALELLWSCGKIAVTERVGFQRRYDLTERVIPSDILDRRVDPQEVWRFFLQRALSCLVIGTRNDIADYLSLRSYMLDLERNKKQQLDEKLHQFVEEDTVVKVDLAGVSDDCFCLAQAVPFIHQHREREAPLDLARFLTPFDNVVWDRKRVKQNFDFTFSLEAYLPKEKRTFGYYGMPILWNDQLIGRIDPKADRANKTLIFRNVEIVSPYQESRDALDAVSEEIRRFMVFHKLDTLEIEKARPKALKVQLTK